MTSFLAAPPDSYPDGALAYAPCRCRSISRPTRNGNLETYKRGESAKLKLLLRRRTAVDPPGPFAEGQSNAGVGIEQDVGIDRVADQERIEPSAV